VFSVGMAAEAFTGTERPHLGAWWAGIIAGGACCVGIPGALMRRNQCLRVNFIIFSIIAIIACAVGTIYDGLNASVIKNNLDFCYGKDPLVNLDTETCCQSSLTADGGPGTCGVSDDANHDGCFCCGGAPFDVFYFSRFPGTDDCSNILGHYQSMVGATAAMNAINFVLLIIASAAFCCCHQGSPVQAATTTTTAVPMVMVAQPMHGQPMQHYPVVVVPATHNPDYSHKY